MRRILVLGGGNALGAFEAGACEALIERGWEPDRVAGASVGAVNGALFAGSRPDDRLDRLGAFWRLAEAAGPWSPPTGIAVGRRFYNNAAAVQTFLAGRPGLFTPRLASLTSFLPGSRAEVSLYDTAPLAATLRRLIDFDRLAAGPVRLTVTAVDMETGEDVLFDSARDPIGPMHLVASTAFPVAYPPVEIDGRLLCDPGVSDNLPLRAVLADPPDEETICVAVDLFPMAGRRPATLGNAAERGQDLLFASQARHAIDELDQMYRLRRAAGETVASVTLLRVAPAAPVRETAAKAFDFSAASIRDRWAEGRRLTAAALDALSAGPDAPLPAGVTIRRLGEAAVSAPAPPRRRPARARARR